MAKANKYQHYTREQLLAEVEKLSKRKKYGLVWEEEKTKEQFEKEAEGKLPVLVEDKKREIRTDPDKPVNILIEGDNYHALSVLNYTHPKSIDVIYIDPPYNTGNNDFKYNDKFVDREDTYRHSKWLTFMGKRLRLAKNLLKDTGVIFISIDDNEVAQLKLLCDEIFFESNFITHCALVNNIAGRSDKKHIALAHEYVLVYQRSDAFESTGIDLSENLLKEYRYSDIKGLYRLQGLRKRGANSRREDRPNLYYPIFYNPKTQELSLESKKGLIQIIPKLSDGSDGNWRWGKNTLHEKKNMLYVKEGKEKYEIFERVYLNDEHGSLKTTKLKSFLFDSDYTTDTATSLLGEILPSNNFNNPKSIFLLKDLIQISTPNKMGIALDFFGGSGTLGHSVLELNKKDGGKRQFILCTNNENNICTEVCYPRIRNVIKGYKNSKGEKIQGLGGNLKYYKTDFVGSEPSHRNKKQLTDKSIEMLCVKENTFDEVLSKKELFIFRNKERYAAMLFNERKMVEFKKEISKLKLPVSVYVFSLEGDDYHEDFEELNNDITLCSIPEAILKVYRRIYGKAKLK